MEIRYLFKYPRVLVWVESMVDLSGTNPVSGEEIDTTDPGDWTDYAIGGTVLVAALMFGKFVTNMVSESTGVGDTVGDAVMELS